MAKKQKTICPISRDQFKADAKPIEITINGQNYTVPVKIFKTGSLGWYLNNKIEVPISGQSVTVQIGLNMTIVGSKDLPGGPPPEGDGAAESDEAAESSDSMKDEPATGPM